MPFDSSWNDPEDEVSPEEQKLLEAEYRERMKNPLPGMAPGDKPLGMTQPTEWNLPEKILPALPSEVAKALGIVTEPRRLTYADVMRPMSEQYLALCRAGLTPRYAYLSDEAYVALVNAIVQTGPGPVPLPGEEEVSPAAWREWWETHPMTTIEIEKGRFLKTKRIPAEMHTDVMVTDRLMEEAFAAFPSKPSSSSQ